MHAMGSSFWLRLGGGRPDDGGGDGGAGKAEREKTDPVPVFIHRFLFIWAKGAEGVVRKKTDPVPVSCSVQEGVRSVCAGSRVDRVEN